MGVLNGRDNKGTAGGSRNARGANNNAPAEEAQLLPLFRAAGYILTRPETEVKVSDQYIPGIRVVRKNVDSTYKEALANAESTERLLAQKQTEVTQTPEGSNEGADRRVWKEETFAEEPELTTPRCCSAQRATFRA